MRGKFVILLVGVLLGFLFLIFPETTLAATYTVNKTADTNDGTCDADCSLREAVTAANGNAGADTIEFNIPTNDSGYTAASGSPSTTYGFFTITTTSQLTLTDDDGVFINGYSQPNASRNTASFGQMVDANILIEITHTANFTTLVVQSNNNHVTGLAINNNSISTEDVDMNSGADSNWFEGNFFGTKPDGLTSISSVSGGSSGKIQTRGGSDSNTIGTNGDGSGDVGERNLFMGTSTHAKVFISQDATGNNNIVAGNYIGVNKTSRACAVTSGVTRTAIFVSGGTGNRIGTNYDGVSDSEEANILACVWSDIRSVLRIGVSGNIFQGNYIGTNTYGDKLNDTAIPGISVDGGSSMTIKGNTIAKNNGIGIQIYITNSVNITVSRNIIYGNTTKDISVNTGSNINDISVNDIGDADTGPNDLMNYPVITSVSYEGGSRYKLKGTMDFHPSEAPINIEIFKSNDNQIGHGGSIQYLGAANTDNSGNWEALVDVPGEENTRRVAFTTTATNANGSTSEFSQNVAIGGSVPQPQYSTCQEKSSSYPPLVKVISTTSNSIKFSLTPFPPSFTDFTHYFLEYGEKPDTYYYGNTNITSKQNTSYTVTKLKPATTYFLRFGMANGCAAGPWTNEIKARTSGGETKETTPEPQTTPIPTSSLDEFDLEQLPKPEETQSQRSKLLFFLPLLFLLPVFFFVVKRRKKIS